MLNKLKKYFNDKKEPEMEQEDTQADLVELIEDEQLATANEALASTEATLKEMSDKIAELSAKLEQATAALAATESAKAALEAEAKAKRFAARKEKVEAAIGENEKAEKLLAATEQMEDAQFEAVVSALAGSVEQEAKSEMFKEVGVAAEAAPVEVDPVQKLAAKMAAQFKQVKE